MRGVEEIPDVHQVLHPGPFSVASVQPISRNLTLRIDGNARSQLHTDSTGQRARFEDCLIPGGRAVRLAAARPDGCFTCTTATENTIVPATCLCPFPPGLA